MRFTIMVVLLSSQLSAAQDLTDAQREAAAIHVRQLGDCLRDRDREMQEIVRLLSQAEQQRASSDTALRRDAIHTIEALVARAHQVQERSRACLGAELPSPGTHVEERDAPSDESADHVAQSAPSLRVIEENTALASNVHVVHAEQVDGTGQLPSSVVRDAVHAVGRSLGGCGSGGHGSTELELVFTVPASGGNVRAVQIERTGVHDSRVEGCVRNAAQQIRFSRAPSGGEATYSYTLRLGR